MNAAIMERSAKLLAQAKLFGAQGAHGLWNPAFGGQPMMPEATKFLELCGQPPTEDAMKKMKSLIERARSKEHDAITELNGIRTVAVQNFIYAQSGLGLRMFEPVILAHNEVPYVKNTFKTPVNVAYTGEDGRVKRIKALNPNKVTRVDLWTLQSDMVETPLRDVYQGTDVAAAAQATFDISFDMANAIDAKALAFLTSAGVFGSFTTTGSNIDRAYIAHANINTANLPTTNSITLSGNTSSSLFRLAVMRATLDYCMQWANVWGAPLRPTGLILVPSLDAGGINQEIVPTGSTSNPVADAVLLNYTNFSYMGVNWVIVPDATLAPGTCYPILNRPAGWFFSKPSLAQEFHEVHQRENREERMQEQVIGFATSAPLKVNALRIIYRTV